MKYFVLLLGLAASFPAYSQETASKLPLAIEDPRMDAYLAGRKPATLTIKLLNAPADLGPVNVKGSFVHYGPDFQTTKHYQIGKDRELTVELEQNLPYQQIWLHVGEYLYAGIYVNTGLTVNIDLDRAKSAYMIGEGISYSGTDGKLNAILNEHVLFRRDERRALSKQRDSLLKKMDELPEGALWVKLDSLRSQRKKINAEFIAKYPTYGWAVTNEENSAFYNEMCIAYRRKRFPEELEKEVSAHKPFFTSNDGVQFYRYLSWYLSSGDDHPRPRVHEMIMADYDAYTQEEQALLDTISSIRKFSEEERKEKQEVIRSWYKKWNEVFYNDIVKINTQHEAAIFDSLCAAPRADILKLGLLKQAKSTFAKTFPLLSASAQTAWCRRIIEKELEESLASQKQVDALLASGNALENPQAAFGRPVTSLPFGASLYRLDSLDNADDFIRALLSRFKDKALIIDFWATWCGPCISAMPYAKKLQKENADLPVEYIYLCTSGSSNETLWKNKVAELKIPGTHIFVADRIIAGLKSRMDAGGGYPAYVLVDSRGNINARRINGLSEINRDVLKALLE
ncbi:thiol-disulfide isomerase/thioredoxin [Anseongella ginsenosidimutans]|uniref:Thiol-disulfide isomerase/thioredoxin n=1 Tax=Anseongella ginsenosidimutans TaxID=496056 RepID=A0A4R3KYY0_9SPHI|nr:TlpA family protein disulfide reductase [Anseongella ginsenosidimutans]QEC51829.1 redoxin domain-containing protein [Anseongella ginsenosidimutans]TCS89202.1 thiol-disulfide isomerase/thioredoxin [Anseongella ginsenosidimutans]